MNKSLKVVNMWPVGLGSQLSCSIVSPEELRTIDRILRHIVLYSTAKGGGLGVVAVPQNRTVGEAYFRLCWTRFAALIYFPSYLTSYCDLLPV